MLKSACLFCLVILLASSSIEVNAQLPKPAGPYCIGQTKMQLTDTGRSEYFTEDPDDFRFLVIDIWYPGDCTGTRAPYIHPEVLKGYKRKEQESDSLDLAFISATEAHSFQNSAFAPSIQSAPVLIFSPGASTPLAFYTSLFEHMASHGYVVMGLLHTFDELVVENPEGTFFYRKQAFFDRQFDEAFNQQFSNLLDFVKSEATPAEKLEKVRDNFTKDFPTTFNTKRRAHDIAFIADQINALNDDPNSLLYQKMDPDKIGGFGHSFGGAAMGQALFIDSSLKAAINLDGWQFGDMAGKTFSKPLFFVWGDYAQPDALNKVMYHNAGELFTQVKMKGTSHSNFSDFPLIPGTHTFSNLGTIDGTRNALVLNALVKGYFDRQLLGKPELWGALKTSYEELTFGDY